MRRTNFMSELQQDASFALRTLWRNAGFTTVIVLALALGIGANTAIFTLIDAVLVRQLPVPHPEQLVALSDPGHVNAFSQGSPRTDVVSAPLYRDIVARNTVFSGVAASARTGRLDMRIGNTAGELEHPTGRFVSGNYFSVLGVRPLAGSAFDSTADTPGAVPAIVISHAYWTQRFHNDQSVIGSTVTLDGVKVVVTGVMQPSFTGEIVGSTPDLWIPMGMHDVMRPSQRILKDRATSWLIMIGRLAPGRTLAQAAAQIPVIINQSVSANSPPEVAQSFLQGKPKYYISAGDKGLSRVRVTFEAPLITLMIGVALLLCIICANVANLLLARAVARGREIAVRLALGADRSRLVRQLLTESVLLALVSAAVGMFVAWAGSRAVVMLASDGATLSLDLGIDVRVLGFTAAVSVFAVLLFGLAPALRASRVDLAATMRGSASAVAGSGLGQRGSRAPLGRLLVAGQIAVSVVLLIGTAMLVRSLRNVQGTDVGFDSAHMIVADVDIISPGLLGDPLYSMAHALRERLAAIPGVVAVTFSENGLFNGTESAATIQVPGFTMTSPDDSLINYDNAGPGYAHALGAHLLAGRDLESGDEGKPARVGLINEAAAKFYFAKQSAVGKYMRFSDSIPVQIIGVIGDIHDHALAEAPPRRIYFPYAHTDTNSHQLGTPGDLRMEIRTRGDPSALVQQVRQAIVATDRSLPISGVDPLPTLMRQSIREARMVTQLATAFGILALILAAIGLYGVMTYAVTRRTGEIGLRVALGAQQSNVVTMILLEAMWVVAIGVAIGLPIALALTRLLTTQLHGVSAADPTSVMLAVGVLGGSAIVAAMLPALRASKVPPMEALRTS
jgi:predicted permease